MLRARFLLVALAAAASLAAIPAHADVKVKVPFSFMVDGKLCPAGTYRVKNDRANNALTLVGRDSRKTFSWIVVPMTGEGDSNRVVLQFDGIGSDHALRSIQYGAASTSRLDTHDRQSDEAEGTAQGGR
ncbi:MAG TPA: hypothetical protein VHZ28_13335 [Terracidiphilus sp.]|jgi:hypothetical protein|nr:hypothetical protein [Terracidiphilus sp.]